MNETTRDAYDRFHDDEDVPECDREKWCDMPGGHSGECRSADEALAEPPADSAPDGLLDIDRLRGALHDAGIGCKPNVVKCRASHRGHAERIAFAYGPTFPDYERAALSDSLPIPRCDFGCDACLDRSPDSASEPPPQPWLDDPVGDEPGEIASRSASGPATGLREALETVLPRLEHWPKYAPGTGWNTPTEPHSEWCPPCILHVALSESSATAVRAPDVEFVRLNDPWPSAISDGLTPCPDCGAVPRFDYHVSYEFWRRWVPDEPDRLGVVCLPCLDRRSGGVGLAAALEFVQWTGTGHTVEMMPARRIEYEVRALSESSASEPDTGLRAALETGRQIVAELTAWAGRYGGLPQTLQDRADWWRLDIDPALPGAPVSRTPCRT